MTAQEAQPWLAWLKQATGLDWNHRVDHRARDEFRAASGSFELHIWASGRWAIYGPSAHLLSPAPRQFQEAFTQLGAEFRKRLAG